MPESMAIKLAAPAPAARPRITYTVPESARTFPADFRTFTLQPVTAQEETDANKVAEASGKPLNYELLRRSIVAVDGRPINWDGDDPQWVERVSPKCRLFALRAFLKWNSPTEEEDAAFFASETVET